MQFTTNVGTMDRMLRIVIGLALIGFTLSGAIGFWGWIGVVPLFTAFFKFCPLYSIAGVKTCSDC